VDSITTVQKYCRVLKNNKGFIFQSPALPENPPDWSDALTILSLLIWKITVRQGTKGQTE